MWFSRNSPSYIGQTHRIHLLIHLQAESTAELSLNVLSKSRKDDSNFKTILIISNQLNQRQIFHSYNSLSLNFLRHCKRKSKKRTAILYIISFFYQNKRKTEDVHCETKKLSLFDLNYKVACHVHKIIHDRLFSNIKVAGNEANFQNWRLFLEAYLSTKVPNAGNNHMAHSRVPQISVARL